MSPKRILLLHEDPLLEFLFRERLEAAHFSVQSARSADVALEYAAQSRPDLVVMDAVLPGIDSGELVQRFRGESSHLVPVIVLPSFRMIVAEDAQHAGATVLARGINPMADLIDTIQTTLSMERTTVHTKGLAFRADEDWQKQVFDNAPTVLTSLRRALHEASRDGGAAKGFEEFFRSVHGLAEQMAMLGQRPLQTFAGQLEALVFDLTRFPEQNNPSVLRTLSQAIDFLSTLLPDATRNLLREPGIAQVLVVDDEEGARKIVMAAMRLAHLKSMAADTPSSGLAALGVQSFDLIFLDVGLPEMNGFDLCSRIRALPLHEKTPIIFITGMATFQNRVQSSLSGGNDFVGKPFNISELGLKALIWIFKGQLGQT